MNQIQWTGNPFVDTGLCVVIARAKQLGKPIQTINDLSPEIFGEVVGDGDWLAKMNKRLKSYTMVFGNNGPLTQTGTNPLSQLESHKEKIARTKQDILQTENKKGELNEKLNLETKQRERQKIEKQIADSQKKIEKLQKNLANLEGKLEAKQSKAKDGYDRGMEEYKIVIQTLLEDVLTGKHSQDTICECSGLYKATRALSIASERIRQIGDKGNDKNMRKRPDFLVGRDWFPLIGSFEDAQALPAASRSANVSALCLLAVQFLPLGVMLIGRRLACFQTNDVMEENIPIFQYLVEDIYEQIQQRSEIQSKIENLGKGEWTTPTTLMLIREFERLQQYRHGLKLKYYIALNLFTFTNSGTSPECDVTEIPNESLAFLWQAARLYSQELNGYLKREGNKEEFQLLTRIQQKQYYPSFFPTKIKEKPVEKQPTALLVNGKKNAKEKSEEKILVASPGLFELYNKQILERSDGTLQTAQWIAENLKLHLQGKKDAKILKDLKNSLGDAKKRSEFYSLVKGYLADFAENGLLTLEEYTQVFPSQLHPLKTDMREGLRLVWYYLNIDTSEAQRILTIGENNMFTHPKVKELANDVFAYYTQEKRWRLEKFKTRILDGFRRREIHNADVQRWFINLAEIRSGYINDDWDDLCRDENGNNVTYEVIFQLRLELANLYRLANQSKTDNAQALEQK